MTETVFHITPGLVIALVCAVLAVSLVAWQLLERKGRKDFSAKAEQPASQPESPQPPDFRKDPTLDRIWSEAIESMQSLESQLKGSLVSLEENLKQEREQVQSTIEALKDLARKNRVPLTLFELYDGLRRFHKKRPEVQESDRQWHAKIGVEDIFVIEINREVFPGEEIHFSLEGVPYTLVGVRHHYSNTSFLELILYDGEDNALATVRVQPDTGESRQLQAEAIISLRQGPWIQAFLACRVKMDYRHGEISLLANHRDVERLKEDFSLQPGPSRPPA
jgi:hypothetical protein